LIFWKRTLNSSATSPAILGSTRRQTPRVDLISIDHSAALPERLELQVVLPATESIAPFWIDAAARRPRGTPFSDLPVVSVSAAPEETLRAVLGRAGDLLGVGLLDRERTDGMWSPRRRHWWSPRKPPSRQRLTSDPRNRDPQGRFEELLRFAAFVLAGDEENGPAVLQNKYLHLTRVATVDADGLAHWDVRPLDSRIGDLLRAAEAGILDGDPLRPYLILAVPGGDLGAIGATWSAFEEAFTVVWEVVSAAGTAYSAAQAIKAIRARLGGAKEVIALRSGEWSERGARPADLAAILGARPRSPEEVAALLGCAEAEAEALLWGLGFEAGDDGLWSAAVENEEASVPLLARSMLGRSEATSTEGLQAEAAAALRHQEASGERHDDPDHAPADD
jgi:hypothetical protein